MLGLSNSSSAQTSSPTNSDLRSCKFLACADDVVNGKPDHRPFAHLGREDFRVRMIATEDLDEVTTA
jgi:hypothetical protein